jgi:hypothetical protein
MIKFFTKLGVISLQYTMPGLEQIWDAYEGDIYKALRLLKQFPPYQIDKNHAHCGITDYIVPWLARIEQMLPYIGVCLDCWYENRKEAAWNGAKSLPHLQARQHISTHGISQFLSKPHHGNGGGVDKWNCNSIRTLFIARDVDWAMKSL